jgi:hypothetical protein
MPIGQLARVRFDKRLAPNQTEALNARLARLPQIIQQREQKKLTDAQIKQMAAERTLAKKKLKQDQREGKATLGLEMLKTGGKLALGAAKGGFAGYAGSKGGGTPTTLGSTGNRFAEINANKQFADRGVTGGAIMEQPKGFSTGAKYGAGFAGGGGAQPTGGAGAGGFGGMMGKFGSSLTMGNTLGSGLAGFGASQLLGGEKTSKLKRFGIGAGAGMLASFLGGGFSGMGMAAGGLFGGLGGLAGGMF